MSLVTFSLIVFLLAPLAGLAYAVKKAFQLFRDTRGFFRALGDTADALGRSVDRLASFEPPDTERLAAALSRAQASRNRLAVELDALSRVREQWAGLLAIYPRK